MGSKWILQGGPGAGQHTKVVNQTLIASNMVGVCEALLYGFKAGLDLEQVLESVASGAAGSWSLSNLGPRIIAGNFDPGFFVEHILKDMAIALEESRRMGLKLPRPRTGGAALPRSCRPGHGTQRHAVADPGAGQDLGRRLARAPARLRTDPCWPSPFVAQQIP